MTMVMMLILRIGHEGWWIMLMVKNIATFITKIMMMIKKNMMMIHDGHGK